MIILHICFVFCLACGCCAHLKANPNTFLPFFRRFFFFSHNFSSFQIFIWTLRDCPLWLLWCADVQRWQLRGLSESVVANFLLFTPLCIKIKWTFQKRRKTAKNIFWSEDGLCRTTPFASQIIQHPIHALSYTFLSKTTAIAFSKQQIKNWNTITKIFLSLFHKKFIFADN